MWYGEQDLGMARHLLVPVDDSERAQEALEFAIEQHPDATITALHVINPGTFAAGGIEGGVAVNVEQLQENFEKNAEKLLEEAKETASGLGADIQTAHVTGQPSRSIVEYVEEHDIDQVIIGSHGRTGASRILLGSVAEQVSRRSPVPVTIVR